MNQSKIVVPWAQACWNPLRQEGMQMDRLEDAVFQPV